MSSSVLELLEESSDELPRISDLEKETNEVLSSDGKDKNEIVEISDDEIIEISSEEQLPSFEKTQNNNRKAGFKILASIGSLSFIPCDMTDVHYACLRN